MSLLEDPLFARWLTFVLAFGAGAVCAALGTLYGYRVSVRSVCPGAAPVALRVPRWWVVPSFCEQCGASLRAFARQPLLGWCVGCRCGARGPAFYPLLEAAGAVVALAAVAGGSGLGLAQLGLALAWVLAVSFCAGADRAARFVPLPLSAGLLALGVVASPFVSALEACFGAGLLLLAGGLAALHERLRRGSLVNRFGGADLVLAAGLGAWFGPLLGAGALLAAEASLVLSGKGPRPFAPHVACWGSAAWCVGMAFGEDLPRLGDLVGLV